MVTTSPNTEHCRPMMILLRDRRSEAGLTQWDLADKLGVSAGAISQWENGKGLPSLENFVTWAAAFNMIVTLQEKP